MIIALSIFSFLLAYVCVLSIAAVGGMFSERTAIFDPFEFCIAHVENAMDNGVDFSFESEVVHIIGSNTEQSSHLVDKSTCTACTASVHSHIRSYKTSVIIVKENDFCILAAKFNCSTACRIKGSNSG